MKLHPEAPDEVAADPHLYAAWRFSNLSAADLAAFKEQSLSVAAILSTFRDEWRASHRGDEPAIAAIRDD